MENKAQEVKQRIEEMMSAKKQELLEIQKRRAEYSAKVEAATEAMRKASEAIDPAAYLEAQKEKAEAETAVQMYDQRYQQLQNRGTVTEAESDAVIDSLLKYEADLTEEYEKTVKELLDKVADLTTAYRAAIQETEAVIINWCAQVHANHREYIGTHNERKNPDYDVAVHLIQYSGCPASERLNSFLPNLWR